MKNTIKMFGIIVLVTVIGFSFAACDNPAGNGSGGNGDPAPVTIVVRNNNIITGAEEFHVIGFRISGNPGAGPYYFERTNLMLSLGEYETFTWEIPNNRSYLISPRAGIQRHIPFILDGGGWVWATSNIPTIFSGQTITISWTATSTVTVTVE